jgi:hypothetical protein
MNVRWIALPITVGFLVALSGAEPTAQARPATRTPATAPAAAKPVPTPAAKPEQAGLTNGDIIKLVQAGLGETVVMTAIRTAPQTNFQLDAENLIALKKAGVSDNIVAAMLDPKAAPVAPPVAAVASPALIAGNPDTRARVDDPNAAVEIPRDPGVYIDTGTADRPNLIALEPTTFSQGKSGGMFTSALTYGIKKAQWKAVVRSNNANIRIRQNTPTFYFYFEQKSSGLGGSGGFAGWLAGATSPNEFVLAKMTVKGRERELVVGEFGVFGSSTGTRSKDSIEFLVERLSGGVYRVKPTEPLPTGEYSFFYAAGASTLGAGATGKLFDFGDDSQSSIKN